MKYLSLVVLMFSVTSKANWVSGEQIGQPGASVYANRADCAVNGGEPCFDVTGKPQDEYSVQTVQVDDPSKPLYGPALNVQGGFADLVSCEAAQAGHCDGVDPGYAVRSRCRSVGDPVTAYELYCIAVEPQSYEQMSVQRLLPDAAKRAEKSARLARRAAVRQVLARKRFGERLSAEMAVRNAQKGLTVGQKKQVRQTLADIIAALGQGDLDGARAEAAELSPDGVRLTQSDKDWALAEIDEYLASE